MRINFEMFACNGVFEKLKKMLAMKELSMNFKFVASKYAYLFLSLSMKLLDFLHLSFSPGRNLSHSTPMHPPCFRDAGLTVRKGQEWKLFWFPFSEKNVKPSWKGSVSHGGFQSIPTPDRGTGGPPTVHGGCERWWTHTLQSWALGEWTEMALWKLLENRRSRATSFPSSK